MSKIGTYFALIWTGHSYCVRSKQRKGSLMKKKLFFSLFLLASLFVFTPSLYALQFDGWWTARFSIEEGDFVTGSWRSFQTWGKMASYLYIYQDNSSSGRAYLVEFDPDDQSYFLKNIYTVYIKSNIIVLTGPYGTDAYGMLTLASTIVFRTLGSATTIAWMKGNHTEYDIETYQMVRMGTVNVSRIRVDKVPTGAKSVIPASP